MNCLQNIRRNPIPNDVIMQYIELYKSIGINRFNDDVFGSDNEVIVRQTISSDTRYFARIFDVDITKSRMKSLIYKDVQPKNKSEQFILNLKQAFIKVHKDIETFDLLTNEVHDLILFLYRDVSDNNKLQFRKIEKKKSSFLSGKYKSMRDTLEELIQTYHQLHKQNEFEPSFLIHNFYIDFLNIKPFEEHNEEIGLLLLYILLLTNEYKAFEYISFFHVLYRKKNVFYREVKKASFNWDEGFAQILPLHRFFIDISMEGYEKLGEFIRDYEFDSHLNKSNNVENTINKLEDVFSKDEIRHIHPYISDSTINRTLKRLRDDGKIRPIGKGRGAKWMKLYKSKNKKEFYEQLDLKI